MVTTLAAFSLTALAIGCSSESPLTSGTGSMSNAGDGSRPDIDGGSGSGSDPRDGSGGDTGTGARGDATGVVAVSADTFLSSLGVNTHIAQGYNAHDYVAPLKFLGVRNIREGAENVSNTLMVHQETGVLVNLVSYCDLNGQIAAGKQLAAAGALLALEGTNEPNNFTVTYKGQKGGGAGTWLPVAQCQRDLYELAKSDAVLKSYPVFTVSEEGAEIDNVGLQFLTIPNGSNLSMPDGTVYADYANCHNYVSGNANVYESNMAWNAASSAKNTPWIGDGLWGEFGSTWLKHYAGYSEMQIATLPRVTTETGWDSTNSPGGQSVQGVVLVNTYLSQFKQGWRYTFIYELVDEQGSTGDQGLYTASIQPKLAATYIHNLTTTIADATPLANPGKLNYSIPNQPETVHDLLLQKSNGTFELVVWDENAKGTDAVAVNLGTTRTTVNVYDVTKGTTPTQTLSNVSTVSLTMSDHAVILEIPQ
ncbi:hypothetical protein AKJ09_01672 [Labilithrix luteola]|uniref:Glycosyl hydrolase n=2 Tax=Labilithrix luteola TaxID=1391654 RepID=A0A0K1PNA4_9BACT|nr:hypothetical protein AKJ09_01672 [Labilithrix luteola]